MDEGSWGIMQGGRCGVGPLPGSPVPGTLLDAPASCTHWHKPSFESQLTETSAQGLCSEGRARNLGSRRSVCGEQGKHQLCPCRFTAMGSSMTLPPPSTAPTTPSLSISSPQHRGPSVSHAFLALDPTLIRDHLSPFPPTCLFPSTPRPQPDSGTHIRAQS